MNLCCSHSMPHVYAKIFVRTGAMHTHKYICNPCSSEFETIVLFGGASAEKHAGGASGVG